MLETRVVRSRFVRVVELEVSEPNRLSISAVDTATQNRIGTVSVMTPIRFAGSMEVIRCRFLCPLFVLVRIATRNGRERLDGAC